MPIFQTKRRVSVPADIAFEVIADVGAYQAFLPLLQRSMVLGSKQVTSLGESFDAELAVAYPKLGLAEAFVSAVTTNTQAREVKASSKDGPFRSVEAVWTLASAPSGADIAIRIDYAFRNPLLQIVASGLLETVISRVVSAFEARAKQILAQRQALKQA